MGGGGLVNESKTEGAVSPAKFLIIWLQMVQIE